VRCPPLATPRRSDDHGREHATGLFDISQALRVRVTGWRLLLIFANYAYRAPRIVRILGP
jgi:hypothetical protein